jgi:predicted CXXCH cytochrome family protein
LFLLSKAYPPEFYSPFKRKLYDLCFQCHDSNVVLKPDGTGLTGFRDGAKNLHYSHVNKETGRTCRACHEVHASKQPFLIRQAVAYGPNGWKLEINYKQTPTGGSCAPGCHKPKTYDHGANPKIPVATMPATTMPATTGPSTQESR